MAISRSRFDRETRSLGAEVVECERNDVPEASEGPVLSVVAADGTGVPMRKSELAGRAGKQEDGTASTREAKLLRICEIGRTPKGKVVTVAGSITQSSVIDSAEVSGAGSLSDFAARLWREAVRRGSFLAQEIVLLSDGAKWIENAAKTVFAGMNLTLILDLYHVLEKLQEALKAMIPDEAELKAAFDRLKAPGQGRQGGGGNRRACAVRGPFRSGHGVRTVLPVEPAPDALRRIPTSRAARWLRSYRGRLQTRRCRSPQEERQSLVGCRRRRHHGHPVLPTEQSDRRLLRMARSRLI